MAGPDLPTGLPPAFLLFRFRRYFAPFRFPTIPAALQPSPANDPPGLAARFFFVPEAGAVGMPAATNLHF